MTEAEKKAMGKGLLIALACLVVILVFSNMFIYANLQGRITTLTNEKDTLQDEVNTLQSELSSLNATYEDYVSTHSRLNAEYDALDTAYKDYKSTHSHADSEYDHLKDEGDLLDDIVKLRKSQILVDRETTSQPAGDYTSWTFSVDYAGYVSVNVLSSTTTETFVEVVYSSYGVNFDQKIPVGSSGTAVFPVLPSTIEVRVGNSDLWSGATETVTATYYY